MTEELAIISNPGFGMRDMNEPGLWFSTNAMSGGALQVFHDEAALAVIKAFGVYDVHNLEGKPCIVEVSNGTMKYVRPTKAGA